jgi:hypothetical protein
MPDLRAVPPTPEPFFSGGVWGWVALSILLVGCAAYDMLVAP